MRNIQKLFSCALACAFTLLAGCGIHLNPATEAEQPVSLTGDWLLAGPLLPFGVLLPGPITTPQLSLTADLFVSGNEVSAEGYMQVQCSADNGFGGTFFVFGEMADNGTFTLTNPGVAVFSKSVQISISGQAPNAASPSGWAGQYTVTYPSGSASTACGSTQSASFTATPIPSLSGTYTGAASQASSTVDGIGAGASLSLSLVQGAPILNAETVPGANPVSPESSVGQIPLSGTITVTGSPCFVSGTVTSTRALNLLIGSYYQIQFTMNDGSQLFLNGALIDSTASSLNTFYGVSGGKCDKDGGKTTLTRS